MNRQNELGIHKIPAVGLVMLSVWLHCRVDPVNSWSWTFQDTSSTSVIGIGIYGPRYLCRSL